MNNRDPIMILYNSS